MRVFVCFIPRRILDFTKCCDLKMNKSPGVLVYSTCSSSYRRFIWIVCSVNVPVHSILLEVGVRASRVGVVSVLQGARVSACTAAPGCLPTEFFLSHSPSVQKKPLMTYAHMFRCYCLFNWWLAPLTVFCSIVPNVIE